MNEQEKDLKGRFQTTQEVEKVSGTEADTGATSYNVATNKRSGSMLKQEIAAQVVAQGKGTSGVDALANPSAYGKIAGSYTGDGRAVLGNSANTPVLREGHQGDTREAKKLSDANKDINLMASEQYATYFEQPKALAEDRDATVGYNGNPSNISARAQKNSGFTPAELTFDRSIDEITADMAIFTAGQVVTHNGNQASVYPTKTYIKDNKIKLNGVDFSEGKELKRGNFMPHSIEVSFTRANGSVYVSSFSVEETDITSNVDDHNIINDSSAADSINANRAELARQAIDNDHGSPTSPKYNPLGRSVGEPTATIQYLMDIEQVTGALMTSSVRFANKAKAYYLNRVAKDGIVQDSVPVDALYGHLICSKDNAGVMATFNSFRGENLDCPYFSTELNKLGSAAALIPIFDSIAKFKTKADLVNQPRGLKLPLQTGINNVSPFHVSSEFVDALNSIDVFSTIDRGYDPSAPVCIMDSLAYVLPYSWKRALKFTRNGPHSERIYDSELFAYAYQAGNGNQRYYIKVGEPILNGIAWFCEMYAPSFFKALGGKKDGDTMTLSIPVRSYSTNFSLFDYIMCASSAYILYERTNSMKDILDEEQHTGYPFPHMHSVSKEEILNPSNYGTISPFDRLTIKEMKPATAMRWIMPELFTPIGQYDHLLPWYYAQSDFIKAEAGKIKQVDQPSHFPAPVIRSGVALSYLDDFYGMDLKDQLLSIDKMTTIPGYTTKPSVTGYFYKYGCDSEGLVVANMSGITCKELLCTPRQIGWVTYVPYGVNRVPSSFFTNEENAKDGKITANYFKSSNIDALNSVESSFRAVAYTGYHGVQPDDILSEEVVATNRGQAFAQKWSVAFASAETNSPDFPVMLSIADGLTTSGNHLVSVSGKTDFRPFVDPDDKKVTSGFTLFAMMRNLWARIQKLPFIINPFDSGVAGTAKGKIDPFDFAYMFGLSGFMSVTYFEEMSNRMSEKYAKMFTFTEDPYFSDSPLFKK